MTGESIELKDVQLCPEKAIVQMIERFPLVCMPTALDRMVELDYLEGKGTHLPVL